MASQENFGKPLAFLLGAGASAEARLPLSRDITKRVIDALPRWRPEASALNFVVAAIIHHDTRNGGKADVLPDIERVASAIELLAGRSDLEVSPFVSSWDPTVEALETRAPASTFSMERDIEKAIVGRSRSVSSGSKGREFRLEPDGRKFVKVLEKFVDQRIGAKYPIFEHLLNAVISYLVEALSTDDESAFDYLRPLAEMSQAQEGSAVLIGTLNYDLGIEIMARRVDCHVDRGIESTQAGGSVANSHGIRLVKLHGSIDWRRGHVSSSGLPATTCVIADEGTSHDSVPFVVFGQREKLRAEGPFLELREAYRRGLEHSADLVIIGYSFRDLHINELISRWFNGDPGRRIIVVDPHFPAEAWSDEIKFRIALHRLAEPEKYHVRQNDAIMPARRVAVARQSASEFLGRIDPVHPNAQIDAFFTDPSYLSGV